MIGSILAIIICIVCNILCIKGMIHINTNLPIQSLYFLLGSQNKLIWKLLFKNEKNNINTKLAAIAAKDEDITNLIFNASWIILSLVWITSFSIMIKTV